MKSPAAHVAFISALVSLVTSTVVAILAIHFWTQPPLWWPWW